MSEPLDRWAVPSEFTVARAEHVLPQTRLPTFPELELLTYVAVEKRLGRRAKPVDASEALIDLAAWQLAAGAPEAMLRTVRGLLSRPAPPAQRLTCLRLLWLAPADAGAHTFRSYAELWKQERERPGPLRVELALAVAGHIVADRPDKSLEVLSRVAKDVRRARPLVRGMFALVLGAARAELGDEAGYQAALDQAHARFARIGHDFALAQCALLAFRWESRHQRRPAVMQAVLEHAVYRYLAAGRWSWAARTITHGLVPSLAEPSDADLAMWFGLASSHALGSRSLAAAESVLNVAARLGFAAQLDGLGAHSTARFRRVHRAPTVVSRSSE